MIDAQRKIDVVVALTALLEHIQRGDLEVTNFSLSTSRETRDPQLYFNGARVRDQFIAGPLEVKIEIEASQVSVKPALWDYTTGDIEAAESELLAWQSNPLDDAMQTEARLAESKSIPLGVPVRKLDL